MAQKAVKKDDDSETGYRFGAETGVRLQLAPWARLSITGSVDHFTDVPTAVLPSFEDDRAAHVDFDDLTDWRVGVRLTLARLGRAAPAPLKCEGARRSERRYHLLA
jgi:hypothetical protein